MLDILAQIAVFVDFSRQTSTNFISAIDGIGSNSIPTLHSIVIDFHTRLSFFFLFKKETTVIEIELVCFFLFQ